MENGDEPAFELVPGVTVVLASLDTARSVFLDVDDPWLAELQQYELSARRGAACTLEEFMEYQAANARPWPAGTLASFEPTLAEMGSMLARMPVFVRHLPQRIRLVLSTGCEEARLGRKVAYCRGLDTVVVGEANLKSWLKPDKMKRLMLHELWHIFSRNAPHELVDEIYSVFGFKRIPKKRGAPYPEEIAPLRFTNPDGYFASHFIEVKAEEEGVVLPLVPLVFVTPYEVEGPENSPFDYLTVVFGVLRIEQREEEGGGVELSWVTEEPEREEGAAAPHELDAETTLMVPPQLVPDDFWRQVSRNTGYILHPDEIAAENFVLAAMKTACDNPGKVEQLELLLRA